MAKSRKQRFYVVSGKLTVHYEARSRREAEAYLLHARGKEQPPRLHIEIVTN